MKLLIAEDESIIAMSLASQLTALGHEVVALCQTGGDCVLKTAEERPDAVFMDICMESERAGIEAAKLIRQSVGTPIVFCSAFDDPETRRLAGEVKAVAFVSKPFSKAALRQALNAIA